MTADLSRSDHFRFGWWRGWALPIVEIGDLVLARQIQEPPQEYLHVIREVTRFSLQDPVFLVGEKNGRPFGFQYIVGKNKLLPRSLTGDALNSSSASIQINVALMWIATELLNLHPWDPEVRKSPIGRLGRQSVLSRVDESADSLEQTLREARQISERMRNEFKRQTAEELMDALITSKRVLSYGIDVTNPGSALIEIWFNLTMPGASSGFQHRNLKLSGLGGHWTISKFSIELTGGLHATPLEAMEAVPLWWPASDPEGYLDKMIPPWDWIGRMGEFLESYQLLGEMPLLWPLDEFVAWGVEQGRVRGLL